VSGGQVDWRKEPPPDSFEMVQDDGMEPTIFPASAGYNRDKAAMASALDCEYIEVRMETYWMQWAAVDAEEEWRRERCECENPVGGTDEWCCEPITECPTSKPAESVWDFWDERGTYCPWIRCKSSTPGGIKFRRGEIR
jgi:hypothetical protein